MQENSDQRLASVDPDDDLSFLDDWEEGSANELPANFTPTVSELGILARHYVDEVNRVPYFARAYGQGISGSQHNAGRYAAHRLSIIEERLGKMAFDEAVRSTKEGWERSFGALQKAEENLTQCAKCGRERQPFEVLDFADLCKDCSEKEVPT